MSICRQRRERVTFERPAALAGGAVRNALGVVEPGTWTELGGRSARVSWGSGGERRSAGLEGAVQSATFFVLSDELTRTITERDRLRFNGLIWDISSVVPGLRTAGPPELEVTATAAKG